MSSRLRIVVTGLIAQHPHLGGVAWDYVQYAAGLDRLGHDVYYFEDSGEWPYNTDGGPTGNDWVARDCRPNVLHLARVMDRFGLGERWAYRFPIDGSWHGLPDSRRKHVLDSADLLLNVSGTLEWPERYENVTCRAYVDSDPVFTQIRLLANADEPMPDDGENATAFRRRVDSHHVHFTFGETLPEDLRATGHTWLPTRQPVLLSEWRPRESHGRALTTIMSWTSYPPLVHAGRTYGQKNVELSRFLDLPKLVPQATLGIAMNPTHHANWESVPARDAESSAGALARRGWRVFDARRACSELTSYRRFVESSAGEWSVAKNGYVVGRSGWFSCRSACYLAAGRPVVVQDTGFGCVLPVGTGILAFRTPSEAAAAVEEVTADYSLHASAARPLAESLFDSDKVLAELVEEALRVTPAATVPGGRP
ncbi:MAG: hypothetical protein M3279_09110 [Actinomycetota bacterium]|nr:hypothetical protein [Actinomycetota bacterium]